MGENKEGRLELMSRGADGIVTKWTVDASKSELVRRGTKMDTARKVLSSMGFEEVWSRMGWHEGSSSHPRDSTEGERVSHVIWAHPAGILAVATGYDGVGAEAVNALRVYCQATSPNQFETEREGSGEWNGGLSPNMDGTTRADAHADVINGYSSIGSFLGWFEGKVIERKWSANTWLWVERGHWTDRCLTGQPRASGEDEEEDDAEWGSFVDALTQKNGWAGSVVADLGRRRGVPLPKGDGAVFRNGDANEYLAQCAKDAGVFGALPSATDSARLKGACATMARMACGQEVCDKEVLSALGGLPGGASGLALVPFFGLAAAKRAAEALDGLSNEGVLELFGRIDSRGESFASHAAGKVFCYPDVSEAAVLLLRAGLDRLGEDLPFKRASGGFLEALAQATQDHEFMYFSKDKLERMGSAIGAMMERGVDPRVYALEGGMVLTGLGATELLAKAGLNFEGSLAALEEGFELSGAAALAAGRGLAGKAPRL